MKGLYVLFVFASLSLSLWAGIDVLNYGRTGVVNVLDHGAKGDGQTDDSIAFQKAFDVVCGATSTPTLIIPEGRTFMLQPLLFKGPCKSANIIIELKGNITAPKKVKDWKFKDGNNKIWIQFSTIKDGLVINGGGNIDGQGSPWWSESSRGKGGGEESIRPTALHFHRCNGLKCSNLTHINSPRNHISIDSCEGVFISDLHIMASEVSPNTDGIDISNSSNILIENSTIKTGDDCIAINTGSSFINITGVFCGPGHGISVGSLGKNRTYAKVEEVHVKNCTFTNTSNGARIKTWKEGSGYARKITYTQIILIGVNNSVIIDQEYYPGIIKSVVGDGVNVSDVTFSNIHGTSAGEYAIKLNCAHRNGTGCTNILMDHINITDVRGGEAHASCMNAHVTCSSCYPNVTCLPSTNFLDCDNNLLKLGSNSHVSSI